MSEAGLRHSSAALSGHVIRLPGRPGGLGRLASDLDAPRLPSVSDIGCRLLDIVASLLLLVFFSPFMALVALAVWVQDGGAPIFAHQRVGRNGRSFACLKFRSMVQDAEARLAALLARDAGARAEWAATHKLKNDCRITPLGNFLRRSSLDELPQLWNVLRGEMSMVGPRPIVKAEGAKYGRFLKTYESVRPGLTGLWQISGRCQTNYRRRVALDVIYIRRRNFGVNCWIILMTVPAILSQRGAY